MKTIDVTKDIHIPDLNMTEDLIIHNSDVDTLIITVTDGERSEHVWPQDSVLVCDGKIRGYMKC